MIAPAPDSDGEIGSEALNSSQSSMSSGSCESCSSFSRLSFDVATAASPPSAAGARRSSSSASSKPHSSSGPLWSAIRSRRSSTVAGELGPRDFQLLRQIGSGDIGTVYLCRLRDGHSCSSPPPASLFAMKVVDKTALAKRNKLERAATEKKILRALDHPFLPTLYADFDASPHYSCVVMEYCAGGDLHSLRHRQPGGRFSLAAARFYAAEVLLALEYLHLLGIVYRDLKPENILIRSDGHIMLSDFDLSLQSSSSPALEPLVAPASTAGGDETPSCLPLLRPPPATAVGWRFVAEPMGTRSHSFVGTHEYVAPEVAAGEAHGAAVDWWAYGVFLYELLHGRTPFAGPTNEATLRNILHQPLAFPGLPRPSATAAAARDLISGLLTRDPAARFGSRLGAAEVKAHPFFKGLNFALLRSHRPPVIPGLPRSASCKDRTNKKPARFDFF